jgi:LysM repeat protein
VRRPIDAALVALAVALAVAGAPRRVLAQPDEGIQVHKVGRGDSLELLAAEYYGDRQHKIYIMIENRLDHPRPLKPGERLRIPVSHDVTTDNGDTLASLAQTYLGDARRARFLAEFNGLGDLASDTPLAAGMTVSVPLRVTYRAAAPATLHAIATAFFADGRKAQLLKDYNFLTDDTIDAGESITVPIYLRVQSSKRRPPDAESAERIKRRTALIEEVRAALPIARAAWARGDFATVKELARFVPMLSYLDSELVAEVGVLLGSAYVAFDDQETARATFGQVLKRIPNHLLTTYDHSPKVRAVWQQAGGAVGP